MSSNRGCFGQSLSVCPFINRALSLLLFFCTTILPTHCQAGPPVIQPIADQTFVPNARFEGPSNDLHPVFTDYTVQVNANDPDGDPLLFNIVEVRKDGVSASGPARMSIETLTGLFHWAPGPSQAGEYEIHIRVRDCVPSRCEEPACNPDAPPSCSANSVTQVFRVFIPKAEVCNRAIASCTLLKSLYANGAASGNIGDFYDNRDNGHGIFYTGYHPQLDIMQSGYGAQYSYIRNAVVIGNSSTAITTGTSWGSQRRYAGMSSSLRATNAYLQYSNNNHYWYPEHLDHDAKDHYHANFAYISSSQGSSGSELDDVSKFVYGLAALRPGVKNELRQRGLLMPVMQMIFRRTRMQSDAEYLTSAAHPSAFETFPSDHEVRMINYANSIQVDEIPPQVQLQVLDDSFDGVPGVDFFDPTMTERLFDTPASISRIYRGRAPSKWLNVSAESSFDINSRPLTYHWRVLRGNPSKVRIVPLNGSSSRVRIEIDYHEETAVDGTERLSNRVEVGAFVHNGRYYSAPAFVTSFSLSNESRVYNNGRVTEINYKHHLYYEPKEVSSTSGPNYTAPYLSPAKSWLRDLFHYSSSGAPLGWTRFLTNGTEQYDAFGKIITGTPTPTPTPIQFARCDLNSSGSVNVTDVQLCTNQVIGVTSCTNGDVDSNGQCNVLDLQKIVNGALGGACP